MTPRPGDIVGGYRLERELGQGGMGSVWQAIDAAGARRALKVPAPAAGAEELLRFEREAQALARVPPHPGVVRVHAAGRAGATPFCVLELVEGESLSEVLRRGPLAPARAAEVAARAARALAHVHAAGVLHRDLKPANILLRADGAPVLIDFGLARDAAQDRLTRSGDVLGTPAFMAPEQAEGRPVDARADVYALGATLYALLVGRPPFEGRTAVAVLQRVLAAPPPRPSAARPDVPAALDAVVLRALAKDPAARFPDAAALAEALERAAAPASRPALAGAAPLALAAALVGAALLALAAARPGAPGPAAAPDPADAAAPASAAPAAPASAAPASAAPALAGAVRALVDRYALLDGPALGARQGVVLERLLELYRDDPGAGRAAAAALLAASRADDEALADLAAALDARAPSLLDGVPVPGRVAAPLLRRADDDAVPLRVALRAVNTALRADPTAPFPQGVLTRTALVGAREPPPDLDGLLLDMARAGLPLPETPGGLLRVARLEDALRRRLAPPPGDWAARLALADLLGDGEGDDAARHHRQREEVLALLAGVGEPAPLHARLRALLLRAEAARQVGRLDEADQLAAEALALGSPVPDVCTATRVAAALLRCEAAPPASPALAEAIGLAREALRLAEDRAARSEDRDRRRPGRPALAPFTPDDAKRLPERREDLAWLLAWAGRLDEAADVADARHGPDERSRLPWVRALLDLHAGRDDEARARLARLAPDVRADARHRVVDGLSRLGARDPAARAAALFDALQRP